jgi:tetratricopeptide (TPR) repeat protein
MKTKQLVCLACTFVTAGLSAQPVMLEEAWKDPKFVRAFTDTFLPLTEQEPKITENEAELFTTLGELLEAGNTAEATRQLAAAVQANPAEASAALNYTLGNLFLQEGRYEEAIVQYSTAIDKFDNFRRAIKNLGLAQLQAGQFEGALKSLVKSIELGDGNGDTFGLLAFSYLNTGNAVAALEGYRQAALLNPGNKEWQIGKAEALMRVERYEEAIGVFKQLIKEMPERNAFYTSIANAYLSLNEMESAAHYLEILRRRGEAKASALGLLGDIYINSGLSRLAVMVYADALETGNFSTSRQLRAMKALVQRGYYAEADTFIGLLEAGPASDYNEENTRELLNLKAQLALAQGQDEEAAGILEEVLAADPLNGNALMLLGEYAFGLDDLETAIFYFERAVTLADYQRDAQLQLARIYVKQKEYLLAIRQLEAAIDLEYSANVQNFLDAVRAIYDRSM